ncbi:uncharacterized protein N7511_001173 [Penicillium nucicola]|uniref:uncharacterized protein n=1 Tax=Penicillium nucicola TaxID=1850975 RepID=UPI0025458DCA|nr:uncharacterized protein N7511_001173 [Penicillium nucicola]KAJ5776162.1 hypothetical protein N7511_001173 [Penicillium nucicola]
MMPTVAVLFQAINPPIINGVRKPRKPGAYQDSGADIAYTLHSKGINILTPTPTPSPKKHEGATHLWANTTVFSSHPLQTSSALDRHASKIQVIGQPPGLVEKFDDKLYLNDKLRSLGDTFTLPKSWAVKATHNAHDLHTFIQKNIPAYPIVGKPVRGRGSHGVKVCHDPAELTEHIQSLFDESPVVLLEEFLAGEEATITVMPPSPANPQYWSMAPVMRCNHDNGIAPYNGTVAVTANSRVISAEELALDSAYGVVMRQCERVAALIRATAPIRIDIRRFGAGAGAFAIFDVNMKPNMTGPGRPGREDQASLTAMAATASGWDYARLLREMMDGASSLEVFRQYQSPF